MSYREKGSALLMSLVILLVLSLLATSSMQNSIMQERMSNASREGVIALEIAEATLRGLEEDLAGLSTLDNFGTDSSCKNPPQNPDDEPTGDEAQGWYYLGNAPFVLDEDTWDPGNEKVLQAPEIEGITPQYFIEYRGCVKLDQNNNAEGDTIRNLNFEGSGDLAGGGGAAGPGQSDMMGRAESMRIVVRATGPSEESRKIIESYYFVSSENIDTEN
ncbi:MAG: pilus assembly PilX family protein [Marinobacter sp.]